VCDFGLSRLNTAQNQQTMQKICGTVAYLAPEVYMGESFTTKADIFRYRLNFVTNLSSCFISLGIVLWEIVNRTLKGTYESPYMEYNYKFDYQILLGVSQHNQRPSMLACCPTELREAIYSCLADRPEKRPSAEDIQKSMINIQKNYKENEESWNQLFETAKEEMSMKAQGQDNSKEDNSLTADNSSKDGEDQIKTIDSKEQEENHNL
jgi:serine/threonine protein kinase